MRRARADREKNSNSATGNWAKFRKIKIQKRAALMSSPFLLMCNRELRRTNFIQEIIDFFAQGFTLARQFASRTQHLGCGCTGFTDHLGNMRNAR